MELTILRTADGSTTLLNNALKETYHSVHGAFTESKHVFINNGIGYIKSIFPLKKIRILEIGFGTGLNACLTYTEAIHHQQGIQYHAIEKYPLPETIWSLLDFPELPAEILRTIHRVKWNSPVLLESNFEILKQEGDVITQEFSPDQFHLIFFDAFAPGKQPEMWTANLLAKMFDLLTHGGALVTYCAKGQFKRDLKTIGFEVQVLPGPPGKREMVRAIRR